MLKDIQKLPLKKRKAIIWIVGGVVAITLMATQFFLAARKISSPDFIFFPPIKSGIGEEGGRVITDIEETYHEQKRELWGDMPEIDFADDNFFEEEGEGVKEEDNLKNN